MATSSLTETPSRHPAHVALAALIVLVIVAAWFWHYAAERRAVAQLDPQARQALYARTLESLKHPCADTPHPHALDEFCERQADFILEFPECDSACQALAARSRPPSAR